MEVAGYFRLSDDKTAQIIQHVSTVMKDWRKVATAYKISTAEQERISAAFNCNS